METDSLANCLKVVRQLGTEGRYKEAFLLCSDLEKQYGANSEICFLKGSAYFKVGDLSRARGQWERALSLDPTHERARNVLGKIRPMKEHHEGEVDRFSAMSQPAKNVRGGYQGQLPSTFASGTEALPIQVAKPGSRRKELDHQCILARGVAFIADAVMLGLPGAFANHFLPFIGGLLTIWLYFSCFEGSAKEGTLGKQIMGLKVVNLEGGRIHYLRATGRFLGKAFSTLPCFLGCLLAPFTSRHQAFHDILTRTLVVRSKPSSTPLALGVIVGGLALNSVVGIWFGPSLFGIKAGVGPSPNTVESTASAPQSAPQPSLPDNSIAQPVERQQDPFGLNSLVDQLEAGTDSGFDLWEYENDYLLYDANAFGYDLSQLTVRHEGDMVVVTFPNYKGCQDYKFTIRVSKPIDITRYRTKVTGKELRIIIPKK